MRSAGSSSAGGSSNVSSSACEKATEMVNQLKTSAEDRGDIPEVMRLTEVLGAIAGIQIGDTKLHSPSAISQAQGYINRFK